MLYNPQFTNVAQAGFVESRAKAITMNIPVVLTTIETGGYYAQGDGGGALYKRVAVEPAHAGKFQDHVGAWFEYVRNGVVNVKQFGAKGDDATDDRAAINNAIAYMADVCNGGGVFVPDSEGRYMVSDTIIGKSYVRLYGSTPQSYPYNNAPGSTGIICSDFADSNRWVIDSAMTSGGNPIAYNALYTAGGVPDGPTYNFTVENLVVTSKNGTPVPFGGIRMQGGPGCRIIACSVYQCGTGYLANAVSDGHFSCFTLCLYYGSVLWDDVNACVVQNYNAQDGSALAVVPAGFRWPFLANIQANVANTHLARDYTSEPIAMIVGSLNSGSVGNTFTGTTLERYSTSLFLYNATAANFDEVYMEASANEVCIAAAFSRWNIDAWHAFMSGTGNYFDLGTNIAAIINPSGIPFVAGWGSGPYTGNNNSLLVLTANLSYTVAQTNVIYPYFNSPFAMPALQNNWKDISTVSTEVECGFRINQRTGNGEGQGEVYDGVPGTLICTLPVGQRPYKRHTFPTVVINADGTVIGTANPANLNGVFFNVVG